MGLEEKLMGIGKKILLSGTILATLTGPVYSCPNKPEPKISAHAQYTKEQLTYTYEDFLRLRKYPGHEEVLKKVKLICNNPKQAYNYFSEKQKKEFDEFFKSTKDTKTKKSKTRDIGILSLIINTFKEAVGEATMREDYEKTYSGLVNLKEPKLPDKLMIFLHESYMDRWAEESIKESEIIKTPSFRDFEKVLGEKKLKGMSKSDKKGLESYWSILDEKEKKLVCKIYLDPKKIYDNLPKEKRKEFDDYYGFDIRSLEQDFIEALNKGYEKKFPWKMDIRNMDLSDKLWDFLSEYNADYEKEIPKSVIESLKRPR